MGRRNNRRPKIKKKWIAPAAVVIAAIISGWFGYLAAKNSTTDIDIINNPVLPPVYTSTTDSTETATPPEPAPSTTTTSKSTHPTTTTPKSTSPTTTTPKSTPPTTTTPKSTPPTGAASNNSSPTEPTLKTKHIFESEDGKIKLFNSCSGEAYINKGYLEKNSIGKILYGERKEICAWSIDLLYNEMTKFFINVEPTSNNQYECTAWCSEANDNTSFYKYLGEINVESSQNGDLKIDFQFDSLPFDLLNSTDMRISNNFLDIDIDFPDRTLYTLCDKVRRCNGGIVGIYNEYSGVAYIYKDYLENHPIGRKIDGMMVDGWAVSISANGQHFDINLTSVYNSVNQKYELESSTWYGINEVTSYEYIGNISTEMVDDHLMIEFSINNMPFDLQTISYIDVSYIVAS